MTINLFTICKNERFIKLMEPLFNQVDIIIAGICSDVSRGLLEYNSIYPAPDVVLLDAYWATGTSKELVRQFTESNIKVIIITNFRDDNLLQYFESDQPQGYVFRTCDDFKIITDCIKKVFTENSCLTQAQLQHQ